MKIKKAFLASFSLLTIMPFSSKIELNEEDLKNSVIFFPVVGFTLGIISSSLVSVMTEFFSKEVCVLFYLLSLVLLTGGFHLDGLSDTFDGFSVKSTGKRDEDIQKRLKVMSEGTQGPLGSLSVLFVFAFKFFLLVNIRFFTEWWIFFTLLPVFSRCSVVLCMYMGKSAKNEGLGSLFAGKIKKCCLFLSFFLNVFLTAAIVRDTHMLFYLFLTFIFQCIFGLLSVVIFGRRFGGLTGDTFGAQIEILEVIFLLIAPTLCKFFV